MNDRDASAILARGVGLFNRGAYWEAHEAWEELWLEAGPELRRFVQGLIQLAAAWHHVRRGNRRGADRLFRSALEKLAPYPSPYAGLDFADAVARARDALENREGTEDRDPPQLRTENGELPSA